MLILIQVLTYLKKNNYSVSEAMAEVSWLVDNGQSEIFSLSEAQQNSLTDIFYKDEKFDAAIRVIYE